MPGAATEQARPAPSATRASAPAQASPSTTPKCASRSNGRRSCLNAAIIGVWTLCEVRRRRLDRPGPFAWATRGDDPARQPGSARGSDRVRAARRSATQSRCRTIRRSRTCRRRVDAPSAHAPGLPDELVQIAANSSPVDPVHAVGVAYDLARRLLIPRQDLRLASRLRDAQHEPTSSVGPVDVRRVERQVVR